MLTRLQHAFCRAYHRSLNVTEAVLTAGYQTTDRTNAARIGSRLLKNPQIKKVIQELERETGKKTIIDAARILQELSTLSTIDVRDYYDFEGNIKPMTEWTPAMGAMCAGIETITRNVSAADGHTDTIYKIKLWPKDRALEMLAKHYALLVDRVQLSGDNDLVSRLANARKRTK